MKFIREHILFFTILGVSILLRFLPLFEYQFTLDELSGLNRTRFDSFSDLLDKGVKIDAHPALVQVMIFYLVKFFGYGNWIIKLPFLLFSIGAIVYAYCFGYRNFSKKVGLFAASFFSFSLVFVFYAPIARMYISGVFFSMALLYHFYEIFFQKNTRVLHYVFLALFALLSALNQHINALFALSLCVSGLFFLDKNNFKAYIITCLLTVLAYLPHISITLYQLGVGGIGLEQGGWLERPDWYAVLLFLQILFGTGWTYLLIFVLLALRFLFDAPSGITTKQIFLVTLFLFNYWVVYQYSKHFSPVYQHSMMLFSGVAIIVFVSSLLDFKKDVFFYPAFVLLTGVLVYTTYIKKDFFKQTLSTVFEYQFKRTFDYQKEYGAENIYPVFFDCDEFMQEMYFERYKGSFDFVMSSDSSVQSFNAFNSLLKGIKQDVLILSSTTPMHEALARNYFPYLIENTMTQANNYRVYSKRKSDVTKSVPEEKVLLDTTLHLASLKVDSANEFPFGIKRKYFEHMHKEGSFVLMGLKGKVIKANNKEAEICISVTDDISNETYQYGASSLRSAYFNNDSSFVLAAGMFAGSRHNKLLNKPASINYYIWNRGKEKFTVQEMNIRLIDYWPQKWGFWK